MDGLDITSVDQIDERIYSRVRSSIIDDEEDETYQSALSDCPEAAFNSTASDSEEDPELEHKTKRIKTLDDNTEEDRDTPKVSDAAKGTEPTSDGRPDSKSNSDKGEDELKMADTTTLELQPNESQETHTSCNSNYGSKSGSQQSNGVLRADELKSSSQSPQVVNKKSQDKTGECRSTPTLYQRFIQSNSVSLSKSPKFEALQCPFCVHGFVNFSALETHVVFCKKKKKEDEESKTAE